MRRITADEFIARTTAILCYVSASRRSGHCQCFLPKITLLDTALPIMANVFIQNVRGFTHVRNVASLFQVGLMWP